MAAPSPLKEWKEKVVGRYLYETKQCAYEDALKQADHYAASKGTM